MPKPGISVSDATEEFDVMGAEPDTGGDGGAWDTNEMMRGDGVAEAEPLEDDEDEAVEAADDGEPDEAEAEDGDDDEQAAEGEEEEGDEEQDDLGPIDPPANWPEEVRANFAEMPPPLQHWLYDTARRMQADYTRKTQELAPVRRAYQEFDRVIAPHIQKWALNGMNPASAVQQLIALSDFATGQPEQFIQYFANLRGVDLSKLAQPAGTDQYVDPQVVELRKQIAGLHAQWNQSAAQQQTQQRAAQAAQYQQAFANTDAALTNFARQTGQDGKPLYPFFDRLYDDMSALLESGHAKTVHEAYEAAQWSNPFTRSKLLARQRKAEDARAREETQRARRAASSISGASSMNVSPATDGMSTRQLLNAAWEGNI